MSPYERRLPHWDSIDQPLFVTFRLYDSLPANRVFPPDRLTSGRAFVAFDRILDRATSGPLFLRIPDIADLVVEALRDGERRFGRYELHSFVVMPNQGSSSHDASRGIDPLAGTSERLHVPWRQSYLCRH